MVKELNIKQFTRFIYPPGNVIVMRGRLQITGGVVVAKNDAGGQRLHRIFHDDFGVNDCPGDSALADLRVPDWSVDFGQ